MCLLLAPLLLPLIIWLAEMLTLLRKIHLKFLAVFQDSAQLVHTIVHHLTGLSNTLGVSRQARVGMHPVCPESSTLSHPSTQVFNFNVHNQ